MFELSGVSVGGIGMENEFFDKIALFMNAQQKAEIEGRNTFTCPMCGGEAVWGRSSYNNHLHCGCKGCGFRMME